MSWSRARRGAPALAILAALSVTPTFDRSLPAAAVDSGHQSGDHQPSDHQPGDHNAAASSQYRPIVPVSPLAPGIVPPVPPAHSPLADPELPSGLSGQPGAGQPGGSGNPKLGDRNGGDGNDQPDPGTVSQLAGNGMPEVALQAYRNAATALGQSDPGCQLPWALLAGIGRVESDQGHYGGASLQQDGNETKPILGPRLDGSQAGMARIADSDNGRYDGDATFDRAVGPLQFLPSTWASVGVDADGNGVADPENIFDAAAGAGRYLCAGGGDLGTPAGQRAAVLRYNHSDAYADLVLALMRAYAQGTAPGSVGSGHPIAPPIAAGPPPAQQEPGFDGQDGSNNQNSSNQNSTGEKSTDRNSTQRKSTRAPKQHPPGKTEPPKTHPPKTQPPKQPTPPVTPPTKQRPVQRPPALPAPAAPQALTAEPAPGTSGLQLEWQAPAPSSAGLAGYRVSVLGGDGKPFGQPQSLPGTADHVAVPTLPALTAAGTYTVSVAAWSAQGTRHIVGKAATVAISPQRPAEVTAQQSCAASCSIRATWDWADNGLDVNGFVVRVFDVTTGKDVTDKTASQYARAATVPLNGIIPPTDKLSISVWSVFRADGLPGTSEPGLAPVVASEPSASPTDPPSPTGTPSLTGTSGPPGTPSSSGTSSPTDPPSATKTPAPSPSASPSTVPSAALSR